VSDRVTLHRGDLFRAKGGPYYIGSSGQRIKMAERGPFRFSAYCERGDQKWIEAYSVREGGFAILSLTERDDCILEGSYVPRPYHIAGRVTGKAKVRIEGRKQKKKKRGRTVVIDEADVEAIRDAEERPTAAMGRPDKQGRREALKAAQGRRAAGGRRGAIAAVLAGLLPIAPDVR
jgi:hypothetical protein